MRKMDINLHEKYKTLRFSNPEMVNMYIDIMEQDSLMMKVFRYIGTQQTKHGDEVGITISDLIENINVVRLIKKDKSSSRDFTYQQGTTHIHRKTAEKVVDKLGAMSLIYYKPVKPYKFFYLTERGKQVFKRCRLKAKQKQEEMKTNG